ncbi:STAS/SEC14 domain-containing protein [Polyangium jinanense]|uniref:STAS/SEC14 domain-containing protein n=1 Tax=Polyangium jinanense TaxID=2829994 RepID=A0A9X3X906_9BACT|nr:STAS/SEC14 domain-containing protein [Polyangium jinanense]MDC3956702.1 STAS/SEC14 domain-containing protein [Polyangium jinanense]MDC3984765.1 STAS/SEC14 domain-containing protein [Polyangium jinanense]
MKNDSTERIRFGPHVVTFVPPDLLVLEFAVPLEVDDCNRVLDHVYRTTAERGPCKVLMDITPLKSVPRDLREAVRARKDASKHAALAFVGAPFGVRVVLEMIIAAIRILKPERPRYPFAFFDHKEEALAWLHSQPRVASSNHAA